MGFCLTSTGGNVLLRGLHNGITFDRTLVLGRAAHRIDFVVKCFFGFDRNACGFFPRGFNCPPGSTLSFLHLCEQAALMLRDFA